MKARFLALAALVLGLASCQTEHEGLNVNVGGEQETYVTVSLPETTRANSAEGAFENAVNSPDYTLRYIFQVFYNGEESQAARQVIYTDDNRVSFPVRLVPGRHYNFVVWADVTTTEGKTLNTIHNLAKTDAAAADIHYNTLDLKNVRIIDDQWVAMDETRDAFTGQFDTAVDGDQTAYNSAKSINFTLKRPFAKLRVITTDMEQLNDLSILPTYATVEYTKPLYPSFNAFAGVVNNETSAAPHKTHYQYTIKTDYEYNFNNDEPKVLFTDYLFAPDYDNEVNFILTVYDQHGKGTENVIKTNNFNTPIPAQRNYLTTISGNILTDGNNITVDVSKDFENTQNPGDAPYYQQTISSDVELLAALAKLQEPGANYKFIIIAPLTVDYSRISTFAATRAASTTSGSVTINLNGFTVTFVSNGNEPVITLPEGSELTLVNDSNDGGIIVTGEGTGAAIKNNGSLNIEGVALQSESNGAVIENNNVANIEGSTLNEGALVNNENGQANIEGSELAAGAVENNGKATITDSTLNEGSVENNGQANVSGGTVDNNAIENGEGAIVGSQSAEDLQRAINNAKKGEPNVFKLTGNVEGLVTIVQNEGINITIDGAGFEFDGTFTIDGNWRGDKAEFVKFQNIKFNAKDASKYYNNDTGSMNFIYVPFSIGDRQNLYAHNIIVDLCTFTGGETVVGLHTRQANKITVTNSTFTGMHSLGQIRANSGYAKFDNVTVECLSGINFNDQAVNVEVSNSSITATEADGYAIRMDAQNAGNVLVNGCTFKADRPVIARRLTSSFDLKFEGENTLETKQTYQVVLTNVKDDVAYVAPTGTYTLTGADDFIVYPRDVVSSWDEFTKALAANKTFFLLGADITYDGNYQLQKDVVIDLNGKSMTLPMINIHNKVTIKNGTINGKVYARKNSNVVFDNVTFSGAVSDNLSTEGHLAIQGGCTSLYAKGCLFSPTSVSGSQTKPLSFEGGSTIMKFEDCEFKSSPYKKQIYFNSLSATATLDFTNCNFNNKTPNIMFAAACPLTNLTMSGTTKLGSVTLETNRAKDAITAEDLAYLRESLIANNSISSVRLFYAGGSSEYIR